MTGKREKTSFLCAQRNVLIAENAIIFQDTNNMPGMWKSVIISIIHTYHYRITSLSICQWWGGGGGSWRTSHRYFDYMPFISSGHTTMKLTYYCGLLIYFGTIIFTHFNLFSLSLSLSWLDVTMSNAVPTIYLDAAIILLVSNEKWVWLNFLHRQTQKKHLTLKVRCSSYSQRSSSQEHNVASTRERQGKKKKEMRGRRGGC